MAPSLGKVRDMAVRRSQSLIAGRYRTATKTVSAAAFRAAAEAKAKADAEKAAKGVAAELSVDSVRGVSVATKVTENLGQFKLIQDSFHRPMTLVVGKDGNKRWEGGYSALFRKILPDGTEVRVEAHIPDGMSADMFIDEVGDLVIEHDPLRPGEALFKLNRKNAFVDDEGKAVIDGYVSYVPRRSCTLVAFNGHPVYRIAAPSNGLWSESVKIGTEDLGTKLADEAIEAGRKAKEDELAAKIAALEAELAKIKGDKQV